MSCYSFFPPSKQAVTVFQCTQLSIAIAPFFSSKKVFFRTVVRAQTSLLYLFVTMYIKEPGDDIGSVLKRRLFCHEKPLFQPSLQVKYLRMPHIHNFTQKDEPLESRTQFVPLYHKKSQTRVTLCSSNFKNVKLRQHGVVLRFTCYSDFT